MAYSKFFNQNKKIILFIYEFESYLCGHVNYSNHLHHIDNNNQNDDISNLCPLCDSCHKMVHKSHFAVNFNPLPFQIALLKRLYAIYYLV